MGTISSLQVEYNQGEEEGRGIGRWEERKKEESVMGKEKGRGKNMREKWQRKKKVRKRREEVRFVGREGNKGIQGKRKKDGGGGVRD